VERPPRAVDLVDGKLNSSNEKKEKYIFAPSKSCIFESNKRKFSKFNFFKFMISVTGNHFDMSARAPPNLATPLTRRNTIPYGLAGCRIRALAIETPRIMVEINRRVGGRSLCVRNASKLLPEFMVSHPRAQIFTL